LIIIQQLQYIIKPIASLWRSFNKVIKIKLDGLVRIKITTSVKETVLIPLYTITEYKSLK